MGLQRVLQGLGQQVQGEHALVGRVSQEAVGRQVEEAHDERLRLGAARKVSSDDLAPPPPAPHVHSPPNTLLASPDVLHADVVPPVV